MRGSPPNDSMSSISVPSVGKISTSFKLFRKIVRIVMMMIEEHNTEVTTYEVKFDCQI